MKLKSIIFEHNDTLYKRTVLADGSILWEEKNPQFDEFAVVEDNRVRSILESMAREGFECSEQDTARAALAIDDLE